MTHFTKQLWTQFALRLGRNLLLLSAALGANTAQGGDKEIEFTSDPSQEDFEQIMQPVINPIRQTMATAPATESPHYSISASQATWAIPEGANDVSKSYFKTGGVGRSMSMTRFNLHMFSIGQGKNGRTPHAGVNLTAGFYPYSNQQLLGGTVLLGNEVANLRIGYATLYGSDLFAGCALNGEVVLRVFDLPRIVSGYGGVGIAKNGAAAWWMGMAEKRKHVWTDRYGLLGVNLPLGTIITGNDYAPFSLGIEAQYSSVPKQAGFLARVSVNL